MAITYGFVLLQIAILLDKAHLSPVAKASFDNLPPAAPFAYSNLRSLGNGAGGPVYRAKDESSGKMVALKSISKEYVSEREHWIDNLYNEIAIHSGLARHPHIVSFEKWNEDSTNYYIATEFCDNDDLFYEVYRTRNGLEESVAKNFAYQIALAIQHLHHQNIVHRDVKADNVFLCKGGIARIGGFGFARKIDSNSPLLTDRLGTVTHIAPEIYLNTPYSFPVDIWAFGVLCFGLLFRDHPFDAPQDEDVKALVLQGNFVFPSKRVSSDAKEFIKNLLVMDHRERPTIQTVLSHPWFDDVRPRAVSPTSLTTVSDDITSNPNVSTDNAAPINDLEKLFVTDFKVIQENAGKVDGNQSEEELRPTSI